MREVVMDTETTGLDVKDGDRIIELGCVEIINRIPTGTEYHTFINPDGRNVHPDAEAIHGISNSFLADKPLFKDVVASFLDFIDDSPLVIHNASFDVSFLNAELFRLKMSPINTERVIDTLMLSRRKHPAGPNNLDALCRRYNVNNSKRDKHGAILDSQLLADIYVELLGERQAVLGLSVKNENSQKLEMFNGFDESKKLKTRTSPLVKRLSKEDAKRHADFIETLGVKSLWKMRLKNHS
ncbi:MAG: DNA polymerase III subunit epsilon [Hyphomicrobiaceae bacterium hypho_1]